MSLAESCNQSVKFELDLTGRIVVIPGRGCALALRLGGQQKIEMEQPHQLLETFSANMIQTCTLKYYQHKHPRKERTIGASKWKMWGFLENWVQSHASASHSGESPMGWADVSC